MSMINQKQVVTRPIRVNEPDQVEEDTLEKNEPSSDTTSRRLSLILEWTELRAPTAGAKNGQLLRAHWRRA